MDNPWKNIKTIEYEGHMKSIKQYDLLNHIFKEQVSEHSFKTIGIIGIGCGNGLEHIKADTVVYGYDINKDFLNKCQNLYENLDYNLILSNIDLTLKEIKINTCDILIFNLVVEYIGKYNFIHIINKSRPSYISVVLQITCGKDNAISDSPYKSIFNNVSTIRTEVLPQDLTSMLELIGYQFQYSKTYEINPFKSFMRIDYSL